MKICLSVRTGGCLSFGFPLLRCPDPLFTLILSAASVPRWPKGSSHLQNLDAFYLAAMRPGPRIPNEAGNQGERRKRQTAAELKDLAYEPEGLEEEGAAGYEGNVPGGDTRPGGCGRRAPAITQGKPKYWKKLKVTADMGETF